MQGSPLRRALQLRGPNVSFYCQAPSSFNPVEPRQRLLSHHLAAHRTATYRRHDESLPAPGYDRRRTPVTAPANIGRRGLVPPLLHLDSAAQDESLERMPRHGLVIAARRLTRAQSASGISFKSQFLYLIVYLTRYIDLVWTFYDSKALYNTCFKIIFIGTSAYTVYLMLNDYKPTHDPNLDTFKVQYLLGASAVLAIVFPYKYTFSEVCQTRRLARGTMLIQVDTLGILHLARVGRHSPAALYAAKNGRSRDNHHALPLCAGSLPCAVHPQLDLPIRF